MSNFVWDIFEHFEKKTQISSTVRKNQYETNINVNIDYLIISLKTNILEEWYIGDTHSVADPGLPVGSGVDPLDGCGPPTWVLFGKKCMQKMKELGPVGVCEPSMLPPDPPMTLLRTHQSDFTVTFIRCDTSIVCPLLQADPKT